MIFRLFHESILMRFWWICLLTASCAVNAQPSNVRQLNEPALTARQQVDVRSIRLYRAGLARTLEYVQAQPQVFPNKRIERNLLLEADRALARNVWRSVLDYQLVLEAIQNFHGHFFWLKNKVSRERSLFATYAAHVARYRFALDFIERVENNPGLAKVLNEPVPDLGLEQGAYDRFKFNFLNRGLGTQFAALSVLQKSSRHQDESGLAAAIQTDSARIWQLGQGKGEAMTLGNAFATLRTLGRQAVFPVQAGVSEWMGDTKVLRHDHALISDAQIAAMAPRLQPGDVMLQRREWYVSNVGLPGFWSHAALYIGTPDTRRAYFDDPDVRAWVKTQGVANGDFETLLRQRHARAYATSLAPQPHGHLSQVLEAISEGVSFTTLEHSASADSLVVLRPRLSKQDKAYALLRAYGYAGRPYDFDFDFQTDSSLVCTELIFKAYEPSAVFQGVHMQPETIVGRLAIPANSIARQFDAEYATPTQQWDMVLFLDGLERNKRAEEADVDRFRISWKRPKWHVLLPDLKQARNSDTQ
ncbi:MAG TPA: YiiX/YebB-like N1pC/P60 family cysteine hydrolase [Thiobacillus sp.]